MIDIHKIELASSTEQYILEYDGADCSKSFELYVRMLGSTNTFRVRYMYIYVKYRFKTVGPL